MAQVPNIQQMKNDFDNLQEWVSEKIEHYTKNHRPPYSQAKLAKEIGVGSKTVLFGLEKSQNMSYRKWTELAQGIIAMEKKYGDK